GLVVGSAIGAFAALKVEMTEMPEMVAIFNGLGGGASALVAATAVLAPALAGDIPAIQLFGSSALSSLIGAATLSGSLIAVLKLAGKLNWNPGGPEHQVLSNGSALVAVVLWASFSYDPTHRRVL